MSRRKPAQFEIKIRSTPSRIPWEIRLRSMLKMMLRRFDFRVTSIRELNTNEDDTNKAVHNDNEIE